MSEAKKGGQACNALRVDRSRFEMAVGDAGERWEEDVDRQ